MWYAGIDWANEHHDALLIDEQGHQVGALRVEHSPQGMSRLSSAIVSLSGLRRCIAAKSARHVLAS